MLGGRFYRSRSRCGWFYRSRSWYPGALTYVQDAVPRPAPPPALQLLVLHILQPAVVEQHAHGALGSVHGQRLAS